MVLLSGVPFLALLSLVYWLRYRRTVSAASSGIQ
jgi:hypothetical protein